MKIDLNNFFKFYDDKNPKHVAAVDQLELDLSKLAPDLLEDSSNWVRIYRTVPESPKVTILQVPFYPQTDNYTLPDTTCNSSSCAMVLEFLKPGSLKGSKGDDAYLQKVLNLGKSTDHNVQTKVLESYGIYSTWKQNLSFADIDRELSQGKPVIIGILHKGSLESPTGGHILVVIGKTPDGKSYVVNDPYGNLLDGYTTDVNNGKGAIYPKSVLEKRWTVEGPNSGWGRIFSSPKSESPKTETKPITNSTLPQDGVNIIKEFEGCILKAYYDPLTKGLPITIGWGSTRKRDGSVFYIGDKITQTEADDLLNYQLEKDYLPSVQKIPYWNEMNDKMRGALLSFAYNLGAAFYGSSGFGTISRHLKNKEWNSVPAALMLYVNPGTNVEAGLKRRRKAEGDLWTKGLNELKN